MGRHRFLLLLPRRALLILRLSLATFLGYGGDGAASSSDTAEFSLRYHCFIAIKFDLFVMQQRMGDIAIILPGVYCYGVETGTNYSTNISWAPDDWSPSELGYIGCGRDCGAADIIKQPKRSRLGSSLR